MSHTLNTKGADTKFQPAAGISEERRNASMHNVRVPVKDYVRIEAAARVSHRSVPMQIGYWSRIAEAVEQSGVPALLLQGLLNSDRSPEQEIQDKVHLFKYLLEAFQARSTLEEQAQFRSTVTHTTIPTYGTDPAFPGKVIEVHPNGRRYLGSFGPRGFDLEREIDRDDTVATNGVHIDMVGSRRKRKER